MPQPNVVPRNNEAETLGTAVKRWLRVFANGVSDGTVTHLVSDLRDALRLRGKSIDVPVANDTFAFYDLAGDKIAFKRPLVEVDAQNVSSDGIISTTSLSYIDVDLMSLTTTGANTKPYLINFSAITSQTHNDRVVFVILNINGVDIPGSQTEFSHPSAASTRYRPISTQWVVSIAPGTIVKVRWRVDTNTGSMANRRLSIYAVR